MADPAPRRVPAWLREAPWYMWLGGVVLALAPLLVAFPLVGTLRGRPPMIDLAVFRLGGASVVHGQSLLAGNFGHQLGVPLPFTYPPFAGLAFAPLAALPLTADADLWFALCMVALGICVALSWRPLVARAGRAAPLLIGAVAGVCLFTDPVREVLSFGQLGLPLMALVMLDFLVERPFWPRGALVGLATAVKLIPGLFIVYLLVTRRLREAAHAMLAFLAAAALSFAVAPHDAWQYWTSAVFDSKRIGGPSYYSNQALYGAMERIRLSGRGETLGWLVLVAVTLLVAWIGATRAHRAGNELLAVTIVGIASELVSPIAWIHHLVWLVPALGVLFVALRGWWRAALPVAVVAWFTVQVPEIGWHMFRTDGTSHLSNALQDFFCAGCVLLLGGLTLLALRLGRRAPAPTLAVADGREGRTGAPGGPLEVGSLLQVGHRT